MASDSATNPRAFTASPSRPGPPAGGRTIEELAHLPVDVWVSFVVRDQQLITVRADTTLHAGDDLLILAADKEQPELAAIFEQPDDPHAPVAST